MRKVAFAIPALLAACAANAPAAQDSVGQPQPIPVHGVTPGHKCQTAGSIASGRLLILCGFRGLL